METLCRNYKEGKFDIALFREGEYSTQDHHEFVQLEVKVDPKGTADKRIKEVHVAKKDLGTGEGEEYYTKCKESLSHGQSLFMTYETYPCGIDCIPQLVPIENIRTLEVHEPDKNTRLRGLPLSWIYEQVVSLSIENGIPEQAADTLIHSLKVYELAKEVSEYVLENERDRHKREFPWDLWNPENSRFYKALDLSFIEKACLLHDLGRMFTGSDASRKVKDRDYSLHGILGRDYLLEKSREPEYRGEREELEKFARICERHMGGAGFTLETKARLSIKGGAALAETIIEKIVGYADWRIHAEQRGIKLFFPKRVSLNQALKRTIDYDPPESQTLAIVALIEFIDNLIEGRLEI